MRPVTAQPAMRESLRYLWVFSAPVPKQFRNLPSILSALYFHTANPNIADMARLIIPRMANKIDACILIVT